MLGSEVIDVGVGMALLFLFMSVIATALREAIENILKTRSKQLEAGLRELLATSSGSADSLVKSFYDHPIIAALYQGRYVARGNNLPSYIPRQSFSLAVIDLLAKASETGSTLSIETLEASLKAEANPNSVQRVVLMALGTAQGDLDRVRKALEDWFDGTMDRVSGWYARDTGRILACIGFAAAVFFNVDAITVAQRLVLDKALRQAVVAEAETVASQQGGAKGDGGASAGNAAPGLKDVGEIRGSLENIGYPIGWRLQDHFIYPGPQACTPVSSSGDAVTCGFNAGWFKALFGWLITALAIMLGAPFWFDILNKFMVVRSTVKPKEKSPDEASADAQSSAPPAGGSIGQAAKA